MNSISFKHKLIAVVALTLVGVGYLTFVAFDSLRQLDQTSRQVTLLTGLGNTLANAQLQLLTADNRMAHLQPGDITGYRQRLAGLGVRYDDRFKDALGKLDAGTLKTQYGDIAALFDGYQTALTRELKARQVLGLNADDGAQARFHQSQTTLGKQLSLFSALWQPFVVINQLTAQFLVTPSQESAAAIHKQLGAAIDQMKSSGFYDHFSAPLASYENALNTVIEAGLHLAALEQSASDAGQSFVTQSAASETYLEKTLLVQARGAARRATSHTRWTLGVVSVIVATGITVILTVIGWGTVTTLRRIIGQVSAIAAGDLTREMPREKNQNDEFSMVSRAVNTMTQDLRTLIGEVVDNQQLLSEQASELTASVQVIADNNERVSEQSTNLAGATEEISATTAQVASSIVSLRDDTVSAHHAAVEGGRAIADAAQALTTTSQIMAASAEQLKQLETHSQDIDSVMTMINELANQTNLLALNAAIEAARAGDQGRGFAVVAEEVRSLAERTGGATSEISRTVRAIKDQTQAVISVMTQSRESIDGVMKESVSTQQVVERIEQQTRKAATTCAEITEAIEETARTTREMAQNMDQIAQSIEQNSTAIQAIVASSDDLEKRSQAMGLMTSKFQLA